MNKYFKRKWDETRGDEYDSWGTSVWYLEVGDDGYPIKQIELYDNGNRLKYHSNKTFDDYGGLGDQAIDLNEFEKFNISKEDFEQEWAKSNMKKEHQEIIALISDYLATNYSQRFGQVLFNLDVNGFIDPYNRSESGMKDIHGNSDTDILERIKRRLNYFDEQKKADNTK
jgi:hypothetical protein